MSRPDNDRARENEHRKQINMYIFFIYYIIVLVKFVGLGCGDDDHGADEARDQAVTVPQGALRAKTTGS
jgi:hypothetical protein